MTRQRENFLVLMENYNKALEYTSIAANSAGTAQEKMANYEESIEARTKRLTAAFEEFSSKALNSDSFKSLIDTGTGFVSVINKIIDTLGGIPTLLSAIAATMVFAKTDRTKCCPHEYVRNNLTVTLNEFMLEMVA